MIKPLLSFIFTVLIFSSCDEGQKTEAPQYVVPTHVAANEVVPAYGFNIFLCDSANPNLGFGYNIISDGHIFIHQPTTPSVPGNKGFPTQAQAGRTAEFVIYKLTHHIMPPSVTPAELDSLGVLTK